MGRGATSNPCFQGFRWSPFGPFVISDANRMSRASSFADYRGKLGKLSPDFANFLHVLLLLEALEGSQPVCLGERRLIGFDVHLGQVVEDRAIRVVADR